MERRSFLRGLLAAVAGGEAVVKLATPSEVAALTVGKDTVIGQPTRTWPAELDERTIARAAWPPGAVIGDELFMRCRGKRGYLSVGYVTEVTIGLDPMEFSDHEYGVKQYVAPGIPHIEGRFIGRDWRASRARRSAVHSSG
jgi:hypothetical protein